MHIYADAVRLARLAGRRVVVVGVPGSCARNLTEAASEVWEMPIYYRPLTPLGQETELRTSEQILS